LVHESQAWSEEKLAYDDFVDEIVRCIEDEVANGPR